LIQFFSIQVRQQHFPDLEECYVDNHNNNYHAAVKHYSCEKATEEDKAKLCLSEITETCGAVRLPPGNTALLVYRVTA